MYLCSNGLPIEKAGDLLKDTLEQAPEFQNRDNRMTNTLLQPEILE